MAWTNGPQDFSKLTQLGNITARLLRLTVMEKLRHGQAQLRAQGLPVEILPLYREYARKEADRLIPSTAKIDSFLQVKSSKRSLF